MPVGRSLVITEIRTTILVAAPLAAANLAQMAMQVTNAVMVGHLGAVSLAAAGLGNALNSTLLMTAQGLLTAVAPLAAHAIGAGDTRTPGQVAGGGMIVAAALAVPMMSILSSDRMTEGVRRHSHARGSDELLSVRGFWAGLGCASVAT